MPVFRYACKQCGNTFEELVRSYEEEVICPVCKTKAERVWCGKVYSATGAPVKKCSGKCSECKGCR